MSFNKTVRKVMGLLLNAQGILILTYLLVVAILCFVSGLKGAIKSVTEVENIGHNEKTKILACINLLISTTCTIYSVWILVFWTFINSKLNKKDEDHCHHRKIGDHRTVPFCKMLLALGLISLALFSTLITIQFSFVPWLTTFLTGTPNYVGATASLTLLTLYLVTYFIVLFSSWLSDRCCRESDYYDYDAYGITEEQKEKSKRVRRFLQIYIGLRRGGIMGGIIGASV